MAIKPNGKELTAAIRAPFFKRFLGRTDAKTAVDYAWDNGFSHTAANAAGTDEFDVIGSDPTDKILVGGAAHNPTWQTISFPLETNASIVDQVFFIVPWAAGCKVKKIQLAYATADGAANTATIGKASDGVAIANGTSLMSGTFNLNTTVDTVQTATLSATPGVVDLAYKDRLYFDIASAVTSLAGLVVTLTVSPGNKGDVAVYNMQANGDLVDSAFHLANRLQKVSGVLYAHRTAGTDAGAVNLQVTKDVSTNAPGAGTDLLTNNSNAGFDGKGTIDTVQVGTLASTANLMRLALGDRLAVDFAGTLTALAGVCVVVLLEPTYERTEVSYVLAKNANLVDAAFWIADRDYEVVAIQEVHATAGTDAGAVNVQVTVDKPADAPGAGTNLLSNNTSAGFDLKGTANTVQVGTFLGATGLSNNVILGGERLSVDYAGVLTTLAGVVVTVSLKAV